MKVRNLVAACIVAASAALTAFASTPAPDLAADVMAGLNPAAMAKLMVSEKFLQNGKWPESNESVGFTVPSGAPADIAIGLGGVITVTYRMPEAISGKSIVLTPSSSEPGVVNWHCHGVGIPAEALPASCN